MGAANHGLGGVGPTKLHPSMNPVTAAVRMP
jgi:hypothetical protein